MAQKQKTFIPTRSGVDSPTQQSKLSTLAATPQSGLTINDIQELLRKEFDKQNENMKQSMDCKIDELEHRLQYKMEEQVKEFREMMQEEKKQIQEEVALALESVLETTDEIKKEREEEKKHVEALEKQVEALETQMEKQEDYVLMAQYDKMEFALRIRGLPEGGGADLEDEVAEGLAEAMAWRKEEVLREFDRVYRVNSRIAKERNLPRDIVIYLKGRRLRNGIVQLGFEKRVIIRGIEVKILKEIPPKILRMRKDYAFLVEKLHKRQIQFRWNIPIGLAFQYNGKKYNIRSVHDAAHFCNTVLESNEAAGGFEKQKQQAVKPQQEVIELLELTEEDLLKRGPVSEAQTGQKEQRVTRAAAKRREEELKLLEAEEQGAVGGAVGGAKPKQKAGGVEAMLQKLRGQRDGT